MNLKKIFKVVFVDFMALFFGIINGFLLPKFLSIESYAYIKTFSLYIGYSGIFHLGFSDGMYILMGGKNIDEIKKEKIKGYMIVLLKIIFLVLGFLGIINLFIIKDLIFTFFILYTIPFQITLFVSLLYRATGQFDKYVVIRGIINIFNLISVLSTVFIFKSPLSYIIIQILGYVVVSIIYMMKILFTKVKFEKIIISEVGLLIKTGFIIMFANTVTNLFFSLDRWIIKLKFTQIDFAYYSFGVSMLSLFTTLISSISIVFYPYLAKESKNNLVVKKIKTYIILICSFAPAGYFVMEIIVENYMTKYSTSLEVLGILILSIPFISVINVIYANMYKVNNRGRAYLKTAIIMLIISLGLNIIVIYIGGNSVSIAYATLISLIIWYLYSARHFDGIEIEFKEIVYFSLYIISYIIIKKITINPLIKSILFSIIIFSSIIIFYKNELIDLIKMILNKDNTLK